jgi:hypothetical protein
MSTHIINRQVIELKVSSRKNAFSIQQRVREIYFSEVVPLLDQVMSDLTAEGEVLYLDRLEIDLGVLNFDRLDEELVEVIRHRIYGQLKEQVKALSPATAKNVAALAPHAALRRTEKESAMELLQVFFSTGSLPWWADNERHPPDIEEVVSEMLQKNPEGLLNILQHAVATKSGAQRVLLQLPQKLHRRIFALVKETVRLKVKELLQILTRISQERGPFSLNADSEPLLLIAALSIDEQVLNSETEEVIAGTLIKSISFVLGIDSGSVHRKFYRDVLLFVIAHRLPENNMQPVIRYFRKWEISEQAEAINITGDQRLTIAAVQERNTSKAVNDRLEKMIVRFSSLKFQPDATHPEKKQKSTAGEDVRSGREKKNQPADSSDASPGLEISDPLALAELPPEIRALLEPPAPLAPEEKPPFALTRYAGLALVAPFLPAFFEEMKLLEGGTFRGKKELHKAIHFLHFMATGKTKAPEYQLALHKLLCGAELTDPVPKTAKLSDAEKHEADLFLDDIAGQWTTLRTTSGEAFRETFMRRNGIIEQRENAWLLRIERGPMDILLDTLPWNISIIKLPWMQHLLHVEW